MGAHSSLIIGVDQARQIWHEHVQAGSVVSVKEMERFFDQALDEYLYNVCIYDMTDTHGTAPGLVVYYLQQYFEKNPDKRLPSLQGQIDTLSYENEMLRKLLAGEVAGTKLYTDDGELQDNTFHPAIDFKRDSINSIILKMRDRAVAKLGLKVPS